MEADSSGADAVDDIAASLSSPSPNSLRFVRSAFMVAVQRRRAFGGGGIRASGLYFEQPNLRAPPLRHLQFTPILGQAAVATAQCGDGWTDFGRCLQA